MGREALDYRRQERPETRVQEQRKRGRRSRTYGLYVHGRLNVELPINKLGTLTVDFHVNSLEGSWQAGFSGREPGSLEA